MTKSGKAVDLGAALWARRTADFLDRSFGREANVTTFLIVLVTAFLLILFVGVTIAGGRAHDRQNKYRDDDR